MSVRAATASDAQMVAENNKMLIGLSFNVCLGSLESNENLIIMSE